MEDVLLVKPTPIEDDCTDSRCKWLKKMANCCGWTTDEEKMLITILQDIIINGGRGDNGSFRSIRMRLLSQRCRKQFPKHPNKIYTANKPFPIYEQFKLVFWKDCAKGNMTESATDALENMDMENDDDFATEVNVPPHPKSIQYNFPFLHSK
ncbi:hypothetical protein Ccrd_020038 [Cynara cardunculus var. scolymus]|uniref:Myb/SANT-like domain-containing protein n=1 Tax=Cynara cardunculus var. scolymus TaxID=59895 RepID=A0A103Y374_CYNCS|nr:hypothetical protein Ccrd_020038 [Cynara cardunculus var. scolymus]